MLVSKALGARCLAVAVVAVVAVAGVEAQIRPGGSLIPPIPRPGALNQPPAPETGVIGYEIVVSPNIEVSALTTAATSAQCPSGKVALSAGVEVLAPAESMYGFEVLGAWPDGRFGTVRVRNANVLVRGTVRAYAVCVAGMAGLRQVDRMENTSGSLLKLSCFPNERAAGGGVMGEENLIVQSSAPEFSADAASHWFSVFSATGLGPTTLRQRVLCAPASQLAGWQIAKSARVELGARGTGTITAMCAAGMVPVGFGVVGDFSRNMVWNTLVPQLSGSVSARVQNRSISRADPNVTVGLQAACVRQATLGAPAPSATAPAPAPTPIPWFIGKWAGTQTNDLGHSPQAMGFTLANAGEFVIANERTGQIAAKGTYTVTNNLINGTYRLLSSGETMSFSGTYDPATRRITGSQGMGSATTGQGRFVVSKK